VIIPILRQAESGTPLCIRLPLCRRRHDRTSPEPPPIAAYFVSPPAALRPGVGVDLDLGPYVGVWRCGKITPTLVTESAVVVPYCEVSPIGTSHPRNRSTPAAPVADAQAHPLPVRRPHGSTNPSPAADVFHCISIGRAARQLKRVSACIDDHRGA